MTRSTLWIFLLFVGVSLAITKWASRRSSARGAFYAANGSITGLQNGLAISGEFLSASTLMGITGLYFTFGYDGLVYSVGAVMGLPVLLFLLSDRLQRTGRYTLSDVLNHHLDNGALRIFSACATALVLLFYLVSQLVGAGSLIELLSGLGFGWSVAGISVLMMIYVTMGGMVGTTWVQIVKACFLLLVGLFLAVGVLREFHFRFDLVLRAAATRHVLGQASMGPSGLTALGSAASAALTQAFGIAGLPHLVMRFFTVPNAAEARRSANYAIAIIGGFYLMMIVIGYGAVAVLADDPHYLIAPGQLRDGNNLAPLYLARALGGDLMLGICAAAIFATVLAVVSGITLAVAASVSHDVYAQVMREGAQTERQELMVSRAAAVAFGAIGVTLSVVFQHENVTFLVVTALSIAASSTFPALFLACFWPPLTAAGAVIGGTIGLTSAIGAIVLGPTVWVNVLGHPEPVFPYQYPTLATLPLTLLCMIGISLYERRRAGASNREHASPRPEEVSP